MAPNRKNTPEQPELPIREPQSTNASGSKPKSDVVENGNGETHVEAEAIPTIPHHPFSPGKIELPLHRRVDTSFLQYASYVIRDRAIPNLEDGLKPVQRRIMWVLHKMDDGRFIKVASVPVGLAWFRIVARRRPRNECRVPNNPLRPLIRINGQAFVDR